jgi:Berberine and berberine like
LVVYSLQWLQGQDAVKQISHVDAFRQQLLTYTRGDYVGNPDRSLKDYLIAYYGDNVQRLRCVKKKYDPEDVFHFEQSIPPATENQHCGQKI